MEQLEIKNAIIEDVTISFGDRGILEVWLYLDYGDCGHQGFGGYALYLPKSFEHHELESVAGHFIYRCMEIAGVTNWKNMKGMSIRAETDQGGINKIGHITKDDWFCPSEDFKKNES